MLTAQVKLVWLLGLSLLLSLSGCGTSATSSSETAVSPSDATATPAPPSPPATATATPRPATPTAGTQEPTSTVAPEEGAPENSRDQPVICLTASGDVSLPDVADDVRVALAQIHNHHPDWEAAIGEAATLDTDGACDVQLPDAPSRRYGAIGPSGNEEPTPWHTVIVLLDDARAETVLGNAITAVAPYQTAAVSDHEGTVLNQALIARADSLQDPAFRKGLTRALALDPARLSSPMPAESAPQALVVPTRDRLRICLDVSEQADAAQVTQHLQTALAQVRQHPEWESAFGSSPGIPALEPCELELPDEFRGRFPKVGPGMTETPGPYHTVIAVLGSDEAERRLNPDQPEMPGERKALITNYESMLLDDGYDDAEQDHGPVHEVPTVPVTTALIVSEDFLQDPEFVDWYLTSALALPSQIRRRHGEEDPDATKPAHDEPDFEAGDPDATE